MLPNMKPYHEFDISSLDLQCGQRIPLKVPNAMHCLWFYSPSCGHNTHLPGELSDQFSFTRYKTPFLCGDSFSLACRSPVLHSVHHTLLCTARLCHCLLNLESDHNKCV